MPALKRRKSYAFVAIDRATRHVYLEIHARRDAKTLADHLQRFLATSHRRNDLLAFRALIAGASRMKCQRP